MHALWVVCKKEPLSIALGYTVWKGNFLDVLTMLTKTYPWAKKKNRLHFSIKRTNKDIYFRQARSFKNTIFTPFYYPDIVDRALQTSIKTRDLLLPSPTNLWNQCKFKYWPTSTSRRSNVANWAQCQKCIVTPLIDYVCFPSTAKSITEKKKKNYGF